MLKVNNAIYEIDASKDIFYFRYKKWLAKLMSPFRQLKYLEFPTNCIIDYKPINHWLGYGFEVYVYQKREFKEHKHIQYLKLKIPFIPNQRTACQIEWLFKAGRDHSELGKKLMLMNEGQRGIKYYSVQISDKSEQKAKIIND